MKYSIPDFSILTELIAGEIPLHDRVVIFHWPSNTVLELLPADDGFIAKYDGPKFVWERPYPNGETAKAVFVIHRTIIDNPDDLSKVIDEAKKWYGDYLDWRDTSDEALDDYFRQQQGDTDPPN